MTKEKEGEKKNLNKSDPHINRGFELMIRNYSKKREVEKPKNFQIIFGKMLSLFSREIHIFFEFSFFMRKK
jgi:hypothetical protein